MVGEKMDAGVEEKSVLMTKMRVHGRVGDEPGLPLGGAAVLMNRTNPRAL